MHLDWIVCFFNKTFLRKVLVGHILYFGLIAFFLANQSRFYYSK